MGFIRNIGWVFLWLAVAGVGAYALNTLGFRDYIDTYLKVFSRYGSYTVLSSESESEADNISNSFVTNLVRMANQ